jgi:hypothetical protein
LPVYSGEIVRKEINDVIRLGTVPIFGYPLLDFKDMNLDDEKDRKNNISGWKLLSGPILSKGKAGGSNHGISILNEMIATYRR